MEALKRECSRWGRICRTCEVDLVLKIVKKNLQALGEVSFYSVIYSLIRTLISVYYDTKKLLIGNETCALFSKGSYCENCQDFHPPDLIAVRGRRLILEIA